MMLKQFFTAVVTTLLLLTQHLAMAGSTQQNYFQVVFDTTHTVADGYTTGFGYAVYVNYDGVEFLFDTGEDGNVLLQNLKRAKVDVSKLKFAAISHDHHDHAGGLRNVRDVSPDMKVYIAPGHSVGVGDAEEVQDNIKITPNIMLLRTHTETPTAGISDEVSLLLLTKKGPYLFTGCSHTGVGTIVDKASKLAGANIYHYTGGSRLVHNPPEHTNEVAQILKQRNVAHISPAHCSVSHEVDRVFKTAFPTRYVSSKLGEKVMLELAE